MATRRNVPSKDAFGAIKTALTTPARRRRTCVSGATLSAWRGYHIRLSPLRHYTAHRAFVLSAVSDNVEHHALRTNNPCPQASCISARSSRAFSATIRSTSAALAELDDGASTSNEYDGGKYLRQQPRTPISRLPFSHARVTRKRRSAGNKGQSDEIGMAEMYTQFDPLDTKLEAGSKHNDIDALTPSYIAPGQPTPVYTPHRAAFYKERTSRNFDPRYGYLYSRILLVRDNQGQLVALQIARSILNSYISTGLDRDWELAVQLYRALCFRFIASDLGPIRNSLVKTMLQESPPRLEAVSLLLEPNESESRPSAKYVRSYLADFCNEVSDPDLQLAEAEKLLQGIPHHASSLKTAVLLPLVRSALGAKSPDRARDLMTRLTKAHDLPVDFRVLIDLVKSYAKQGDWSATDALLEDLHHHGYSRSKPYAFAAIVRTIYHHFAAVRHPSHMFDFLTYSMRNQGLVPTTMLSVSVIKDFVASKRYDLVERFVHARHLWFPNLLKSVNTPLAAYEISEAWARSGASIADVLSTCKALAYGTVRGPFSEEFRNVANMYLLRQLYMSLRMLAKQIDVQEQMLDLKNPSSLAAMFEYIDQLNNSVSRRGSNTRSSLLLASFFKQVEAAHEAEFLINHFSDYIQQYGMIPKFDSNRYQQKKLNRGAVYAPDLSQDILALEGRNLAKEVINLCRNACYGEERDRHQLIMTTVRYLRHHQRHHDCKIFCQQLWSSGCLEQPSTIHEVLSSWVRMSFELRDPKTLHKALWAVVDAEPVHTTGYKLLMLVRAAVAVIMEEISLGKLKQYPNQLEELKYLVSRCYRRRWQQDGCPKAEYIADPYLKKWRVEQDSLDRDSPELVRPVYVF